MDPEQRLLIVMEDLAVKFLILLIGAVLRLLRPERMCVA